MSLECKKHNSKYVYKKLLSAHISAHKFDIIGLSENYLNSKIPSDDENLEIPGYNLVREDTHLTVNLAEPVFIIKACSPLNS